MQAVKWLVVLQGNEWSRSYREINRHPSPPCNFITHGFLDPSAFKVSTLPRRGSDHPSISHLQFKALTDDDRAPVTSFPRKINTNFFVQSFSRTLRVMDVRAKNRGRPHQEVRFCAAPVGRNFLIPGHPGVRVRNVRRKSGPKSLCLCCFFFPDHPPLLSGSTVRPRFGARLHPRTLNAQGQPWVDTPWTFSPLGDAPEQFKSRYV